MPHRRRIPRSRRTLLTLPLAGLLLLAAAPPIVARPGAAVVRGTVRDAASGAAIAEAHVTLRGLAVATTSRADGRYLLAVPTAVGDTATLVVRRIGYAAESLRVPITGDTVTADVALRATPIALSEVVVTSAASPQEARRASLTIAAAPGAAYGTAAGNAPVSIRLRGTTGIARAERDPRGGDTEEYAGITENPFVSVRGDPLSTFSIDVDRASYGNVRRFLAQEGRLPPRDAVRIEELVNYFPYDYPEPRGRDPVAITTEVARAPWRPEHLLVRVGLQSPRIELAELPPNNLVFLVDVSGSMQPANKLPLLRQSLRLLVQELRPQDRVAIVVYAGAAGLVLPSTPASDRERILDALERLEAGGSTAGGAGIRLAYEVARESHLANGNNRVILATDGDFNVGVSSTPELVRMVEERRRQGTYLTVLGFGMGNLKDGRLEQLADKGNGNYAYIDDLLEARKVLVQEMGGTLVTVAKDVKLQLEFNPRLVRAFRLIGYENRLLAHADFDDDAKDAGELGAGHSVTALYEVVPVGARTDVEIREPGALRYQEPRAARGSAARDELLAVSLRYKRPDANDSRLLRHVVRNEVVRPSGDFAWAAAVAGFGMVLRESPHRGSLTLAAVRELAEPAVGEDPDGYRRGFLRLLDAAERAGRATAAAGGPQR